MHMVFEGELAVKRHAKDVEVETSSDRDPDKIKSPLGALPVLVVLTIILLGFSIYQTPEIAQLLHES